MAWHIKFEKRKAIEKELNEALVEIMCHPNGMLKDAKIFACQKMRKPPFPSNPLLKTKVLSSPPLPLFENLVKVSTTPHPPPPAEGEECAHYDIKNISTF